MEISEEFGGVSYEFPTTQGSYGQTLVNDGSGNLTWSTTGSSLPDQTSHAGQYLTTDGAGNLSWATVSGGGGGGSGIPAGNNLDVQFNDNGSFGADSGLYTYDPSQTLLTVFNSGSPDNNNIKYDGSGINDLTIAGLYTGPKTDVRVSMIALAGDTRITYINPTGSLNNGSTVTGNDSGATANIEFDNDTDTVWLNNVAGTFQVGETITADSGDAVDIVSIDQTTGDTFAYRGGQGIGSGQVEIDGSVQNISSGFNLQFGSTTGHSLDDSWDLNLMPGSPAAGTVLTNTLSLGNGTDTLSLIAPVAGGGNYSLIFPSGQGSAGQTLVNDGSGNLTWVSGGLGWRLHGNAGTKPDNFIGTTDNHDFVLKANSTEGLRIFANTGDVGLFGYPNTRNDSASTTTYSVGSTTNPVNTGSPNDIVFGGTYSGSSLDQYKIIINNKGNAEYYLNNVLISTIDHADILGAHNLDNGVTVTFGSSSDSYYKNDEWDMTIVSVSGVTPHNFLYTGSDGHVYSAPISSLTGNNSVTAAGSSLDAQFNQNGSFAADTGIYTYDPSSKTLKVLTGLVSSMSYKTEFSGSGLNDLSASGTYNGHAQVHIIRNPGDTLITYTNLSGFLDNGSTVTGDTSGATGNIVVDDETGQILLSDVTGTFQVGETITADSGDSATLSTAHVTTGDVFSYHETSMSSPATTGFLEMTGSRQALPNDFNVSFASSTGHTINDSWKIRSDDLMSSVSGTVLTNTLSLGNGTDTLSLIAPVAGGGNYSLIFPSGQGSAGQTLVNDGSGNLTWQTVGGGSSNSLIGSTSGVASSSTPGATNETWLGSGTGASGGSTDYTVFLGIDVGIGASNATQSVFIGTNAGDSSPGAAYSEFIGSAAGANAPNATYSNFLGSGAGDGASGSHHSNFFGLNAGNSASGAYNANFFGIGAGNGAAGAHDSNFMGSFSGGSASGANNSNFFGNNAGRNATNAALSDFIGDNSGNGAVNAIESVFIGPGTGYDATNATNANFIGVNSGAFATNAASSNFLGTNSGSYANAAAYSNFIGWYAGSRAYNATHSIFIGYQSGNNDTVDNTSGGTSILIGDNTSTGGFSNSIALGAGATNTATNQFYLTDAITNFNLAGVNYNFPTTQASTAGDVFTNDGSGNLTWQPQNLLNSGQYGLYSSDAQEPSGSGIYLGYQAGYNTGTVPGYMYWRDSVFIGWKSGNNTSNVGSGGGGDTFVGSESGNNATSASYSTFLGGEAGYGAVNAGGSVMVGFAAGEGATNAYYSTFIGNQAGDSNGNATHSIFIGDNAGYLDTVDNTGNSNDYSILIGNNTLTGGFSNSIALGNSATNTSSNQFMIGSSTSPINTTVINGSGSTSCTITTGTGISCSSDQRLKTNITDLPTNTLDTLNKVKTVTFNWISGSDTSQHLGFIAQDIQQYYPQLVTTAPNGYLQVNYAGLTPVLVESIRELNLKLVDIQNFATATDTTFLHTLITWLGSATNGITDLFAKNVTSDTVNAQQLCLGSGDNKICVTHDQLQNLLNNAAQQTTSGGSSTPSVVTPDPSTGDQTPTVTPPVITPDPTTETPTVTPPVVTPDPTPVVTPIPDPTTVPVVDPVVVTPPSDPTVTPVVTPAPSDPSSDSSGSTVSNGN